MMKCAFMSDLHLMRYTPIKNTEDVDVLLLSGDVFDGRFTPVEVIPEVLEVIAEEFEQTFMVLGNHESWGIGVNKSEDFYRQYLPKNIKLLTAGDMAIHDGVVFMGDTFWTNYDKENPISLFEARWLMGIDLENLNARPEMLLERHKTALEAFKKGLTGQDKAVIITHHGPSFSSIDPRFVNDRTNPYYVSSYDDFILDHPQIKAWVHGHVHTAFNYMIGDCNVLCNPWGYEGERATILPVLRTFMV